MTVTGAIGAVCALPLRAIIRLCVVLRIHPNTLTLIGGLINIGAAWALAYDRFALAGVVILVANIFDFIDGKVAHELQLQSPFGAFWDSTVDRCSDLALLTGLIVFYSRLGRSDYMMTAALALIFTAMTSYTRARAESVVQKCKVGFMERPERIVLFIIGAFTNRMAGALWVILVLSIVAVANRVYYTYLVINQRPLPSHHSLRGFFSRVFFWTDERATLAYDLWVIAILAFVWLTPPDWIGDPPRVRAWPHRPHHVTVPDLAALSPLPSAAPPRAAAGASPRPARTVPAPVNWQSRRRSLRSTRPLRPIAAGSG